MTWAVHVFDERDRTLCIGDLDERTRVAHMEVLRTGCAVKWRASNGDLMFEGVLQNAPLLIGDTLDLTLQLDGYARYVFCVSDPVINRPKPIVVNTLADLPRMLEL